MSADVYVDVDASQSLAAFELTTAQLGAAGLHAFAMTSILPWLQRRISRRFASEGDEVTGKWAELMHTTGMIRSSQGYPAWHPINQRSGRLRRWLTSSFRITPGYGVVVTLPGNGSPLDMEKLTIAQKGGYSRKRVGSRAGPNRPAPARPVLGLGKADEYKINRDLMEWIRVGGA